MFIQKSKILKYLNELEQDSLENQPDNENLSYEDAALYEQEEAIQDTIELIRRFIK